MEQMKSSYVRARPRGWHRWRRFLTFVSVPVFLICGGWSVYWVGMSEFVRNSIEDWVERTNQNGLQMQYEKLAVSGYPFWFDIRLENITLLLQRSIKWGYRSPLIIARFRPWQPSKVFLDLRGQHELDALGPVQFAAQALTSVIQMDDRGSSSVIIDGQGMNANLYRHGTLSVKNMALKISWNEGVGLDEDADPTLRMDIHLNLLNVPKAWALPLSNEVSTFHLAVRLEGLITPSAKVDGIAEWRDNGGILEITGIQVRYGPLQLDGNGTFALDGNLQPIGALTMRIEGFMETLDILAQQRVIGMGQATAIKLMLAALTGRSHGDAGHLEVPLTIQDGHLKLQSMDLMKIPEIDWQRVFERELTGDSRLFIAPGKSAIGFNSGG